MSDPKRVAFSYADASAEREPDPLAAPSTGPRKLTYPDAPQIYPGRPNFCSGCCNYQAFLFKRDGDANTFKPRQALPGQANCAECAERERAKRRQEGGAK